MWVQDPLTLHVWGGLRRESRDYIFYTVWHDSHDKWQLAHYGRLGCYHAIRATHVILGCLDSGAVSSLSLTLSFTWILRHCHSRRMTTSGCSKTRMLSCYTCYTGLSLLVHLLSFTWILGHCQSLVNLWHIYRLSIRLLRCLRRVVIETW
jgi:hypothetical protein